MEKWKNLAPLRTVLIYTVFGALWILISDKVLSIVVPSPADYVLMQTFKGWLFVLASAALIYLILRGELKSLRASDEKFKYIFDYSAAGKTITSPDGVITANKAFREMLGFSEEELIGEKWREITHPDDIELSNHAIAPLLNGEKDSARFTKRYIHKNGSVVWVDLNTSLRRNEEGEPMYFMTSVLDITERKLAEERIQDLLEFNEKILKTAPIGILTYRLSGECVFANDNAALITGATVEKLEAQNFHAIASWKTSGLYQLVEQAIAGRVSVMSDIHHFSTFGKEVWLTVHAITFRSKHEDQLLLTISDITERKQADEKLQESEETYRYLFANNPHPMWIYDLKTLAFLEVNDAAIAKYGYSRAEFLQMSLKDIRPAEEVSLLTENLARSRQAMEYSEGWHHRLKNGEIIDVSITSHTIQFGGHDAVLVTAQDITRRKQTEADLQASERTLKLFVEHAPASIAMFDRDMNYIAVSRRFLADYHLPDQSIVGRSHYEVFPEVPERWKEIHKRCLAGAVEKAEEDPFPRADGSMDWVRWEIHPWHQPSGGVGGIILFSEVITERKQTLEVVRQYANQLEQKVKDRTAELEQANRAKDEFLANMSHELRTPLNSILGLSESLLEQRGGSLNGKQEKYLQMITSSGSHLLNLINDILDLSKIEAGKFDYYPQLVNVDELCQSCLSFVNSQAFRKSIAVNYNNETSVDNIIADPRRLKQILVNLLTNAVKFTSENGQVTLEVHTDPDKEIIQFSVIDTGIGIAPEDLKRLFTPFVQVDSSTTRQFEGTGLGLSLAQKLTDLHGGSVHVESEVGKGSRFTVNLPCDQALPKPFKEVHAGHPLPVGARSERMERLPKAKGTAAHYRILLAEDNRANILTVCEYLESYGYEILVAHDGVEAIAMAQASVPDIVLMDIQMPQMGGLEAIQRLRADPKFADVPIIALTALAMAGDRERCLDAGATEYMSKPVSLKALRGMIETFLVDMK